MAADLCFLIPDRRSLRVEAGGAQAGRQCGGRKGGDRRGGREQITEAGAYIGVTEQLRQ